MSNYEDAIGRAQAMIDDAVRIGGTALPLREVPEFLTKLTYAQLEVADRLRVAEFQAQEAAEAAYRERLSKQAVEPQSEVEVEGTDVSAELLVAALADGSLKRMLVNDLTAARSASPGATADLMVGIVRGVLMGETPPVAERAASEGEFGRAYTCGLINDDGVMCSYPRHHRDWTNPASHSWNQEKPKSRVASAGDWPLANEPEPDFGDGTREPCGVPKPTDPYKGLRCSFWSGHTHHPKHSWES